MNYSKCIFCLTTDKSKFNTIEHIIPESLGGGDWSILPEGLFCDDCQNKFGSTIEQQALATNPLILFRTLFGIPTKKKKQPWFSYRQGKLTSGLVPGEISYDPNKKFKQAYDEGRKAHTIVSSEITKPEMLARTLIKIGLETIAYDAPDKAFQKRFNFAREYALTGIKKEKHYLFIKDDTKLCNYFLQNFNPEEYSNNYFATVLDLTEKEDGPATLHLKLLYLDLVIPLTNTKFNINELKQTFSSDEMIVEF